MTYLTQQQVEEGEAQRRLLAELTSIEEGSRFDADERRGVRDRSTGRFIKHDDYGADDQLNVQFSTEAVFSKAATHKAGGVPTYVDRDFVTVSAPGHSQELTVHTQVTDFYEWRFPHEYRRFKEGQQSALTGTPLSLWPYLSPTQVKSLEAQGVRTVQQAANLSDNSTQGINGLQALKAKAKEFLAMASDVAAQGKLQAELESVKADADAKLAAMQAQIAELMKQMAQKTEPETKKAK